jgi:hypothetical protein
MGEEGVIGYRVATSLMAYATWAAAVFPSMVFIALVAIVCSF